MKKLWYVLGASLAAALVIACGAGSPSDDARSAVPDKGIGQQVGEAVPTSTPKIPPLTAKDFGLSVKIVDKDCFGSAGCNVDYRIQLTINDTTAARLKAEDRPYEVTYEVAGSEYGANTGTLNVNPDGTYESNEDSTSTKRSSSKLSVKVTGVERGL